MKKPLLIVLALALLLSLCACGSGGQNAEVSNDSTETKENFIGTWKRVFVNSDNETITQTLEVYKGGTGKLQFTMAAEINLTLIIMQLGKLTMMF